MRHQSTIVVTVILLLLFSGCTQQKILTSTNSEQIQTKSAQDLDGDGSNDYFVFNFVPVTRDGLITQRQITVSAKTAAAYEPNPAPAFSDLELIETNTQIDEYERTVEAVQISCGREVGIRSGVICQTPSACAKLCSVTVGCKKFTDTYGDGPGIPILSYTKGTSDLLSAVPELKRLLIKMRSPTETDRAEFLDKTREIIYTTSQINANPLTVDGSTLSLCQKSNYGLPIIVTLANRFGNYSTRDVAYNYNVYLYVKPVNGNVADMQVTDSVPSELGATKESVVSPLAASVSLSGGKVLVQSPEQKTGMMLTYELISGAAPDQTVISK